MANLPEYYFEMVFHTHVLHIVATNMASFSFYSFPGYDFLISRIELLRSTIKFFVINNLIADIFNRICTSEISP